MQDKTHRTFDVHLTFDMLDPLHLTTPPFQSIAWMEWIDDFVRARMRV